MTFTYNLASSDEDVLILSKVRLELGDAIENLGVRPDGSNLSDEELAVWIEAEGNDPMRAAARACDALARMWTTVTSITVGPRREELGKVASEWAKRAEQLRDEYGSTGTSGFSVPMKRSDGYSEDAEASDYGA